jgi:hypothetical protein
VWQVFPLLYDYQDEATDFIETRIRAGRQISVGALRWCAAGRNPEGTQMAMSVCCYQKTFDDSLAKARAKLAFTIGKDNILAGREGFMPPAISHVRSAPAFIFKLNDEGESCYRHGIVGTDDFWEYPESIAADDSFGLDADEGAVGGAQTGAGAGSSGGFPSGPTTRGGDQPPSAGGNTVPPKP